MSKGFRTPPECEGQIVVVSYMCAGDQIIRRTYDRSDGEECYSVASIADDDWSWYETYEQCNGSPPISDGDWAPISPQKLAVLLDEYGP